MLILGISGFIGSGKNTVADYLVKNCNFRQESWADSLKDTVSIIFGWDRTLLEGDTTQSRVWRETVDDWWSARLSIPDLTPRWVLQNFATQTCRNHFHQDIWIASLENKIRNSQQNIVISDCRFENEIAAIKRNNGTLIWVRQEQLPLWYQDYYDNNEEKIKQWNVHASETEWIKTKFDSVIYNTGSLEDLASKINNLLLDLQFSR